MLGLELSDLPLLSPLILSVTLGGKMALILQPKLTRMLQPGDLTPGGGGEMAWVQRFVPLQHLFSHQNVALQPAGSIRGRKEVIFQQYLSVGYSVRCLNFSFHDSVNFPSK